MDEAYARAIANDDPNMPPGYREQVRVRWGRRVNHVWSGMVNGGRGQSGEANDDSDDVLGNETRED